MHEVGIVNGILDTVIRAARGAGASRAVLVTLRIGDMTEVVREALDFAWETFRDEDPLTRGCELFQGYLFGRPVPIEAWKAD